MPSTQQMHTVLPDYMDGRRRSLIIPIELLAMSCHLAPHFNQFGLNKLRPEVDLLSVSPGRRFFLNHFYNYHFYHFVRYWHQLC